MVTATMKPKVSTKLAEQSEAVAARGSSLFKMNLLHWPETLYQKLEKACTKSEVVQVPCRYVDVVSDRIKQVLDELNDYVNPYDNLTEETEFSDVSKGCTVVESDISSMVDEVSSHHQNILETDSSDVSEVYMESTMELSEPDSSNLSEDCIKSMSESNVSSSQNIHGPDSLESRAESDAEEDEGLSKSQNIHINEEDAGLSQIQNIHIHVEDEGLSQNIYERDSLSTVESNVSSLEDMKFPNRTEEDSNILESLNSRKTIRTKIYDENPENIKNVEHIISLSGPEQELGLVPSSDPEQELSRQIRCDKHGSAEVTHFLESSYNITPSESHENELIEEGSIGPDTTSLMEIHGERISSTISHR